MTDVASGTITDVVNFHITKKLQGFAALVNAKDPSKNAYKITIKIMNVINPVIITSYFTTFSCVVLRCFNENGEYRSVASL